MASLSPQQQRARRAQTQQLNQGPMVNQQPREPTPPPSLRERPRALKTQSLGIVPTFSAQQSPQTQQPSPNNSNRRSPPHGQVTRLLPTPPHPIPPSFADDRRMTPPPGQQQVNTFPRTVRAPIASYPNYQNLELQMTPELLADIERADLQQAQYHSSHPYSIVPRAESPIKVGTSDRNRMPAADGSSPSNPESTQQRGRRDQLAARDQTPENQASPSQHSPIVLSGEAHPASYVPQYSTRESVPALRRPANNNDQRLNHSMASQTPPSLAVATKPDRSLPVQEEDEFTCKNAESAPGWPMNSEVDDQSFHSSSPTALSSDLHPEGNSQRFDSNLEEDKSVLNLESGAQYIDRDSTEEEGQYTPRIATAGLPEDNHDVYFQNQNHNQSVPLRVPVPVAARHKPRNGSTEHLMQGLDSALLNHTQQQVSSFPQQSHLPDRSLHAGQSSPAQANQYQSHSSSPSQEYPYNFNHPQPSNEQYIPPRVYPDDFDFQSFGEDAAAAYIQSYLQSPRPVAPIPPTPHSQTAASTPSPAVSGYANGKEMPSFRSMRAGGSPYPFPYGHIRRTRQSQAQKFNGMDPSALAEKVARQWQIYAQNTHGGNVTDSTLSPSSTPFQGDLFEQWAHIHTARMMSKTRSFPDPSSSIHSSPSHQPIDLPPIPPGFAVRKKNGHAKRQPYQYNARKPPPRVESTQPRETSPDLTSSGEETAGEDHVQTSTLVDDSVPSDSQICGDKALTPSSGAPTAAVSAIDDMDYIGDWIDEDDDEDYDDMLGLEYHPAFIKNVNKRRRKWEVGWENLIQSFQALDRQTDATMILMASPSHSTKLFAVKSRTVRRHSDISTPGINAMRSGFARLASQRRETRPEKPSLVDRVLDSSGSGGDGSDGSSASVEENLRRALDAALENIAMLGQVYEQREARVMDELRKSREDRLQVEALLKRALGEKHPLSTGSSLARTNIP